MTKAASIKWESLRLCIWQISLKLTDHDHTPLLESFICWDSILTDSRLTTLVVATTRIHLIRAFSSSQLLTVPQKQKWEGTAVSELGFSFPVVVEKNIIQGSTQFDPATPTAM